ncbi:MAG: hypothetical protein QOD06_3355 [Candidatus Binatota bacterium]|jgi:hypothetical protein|nr:hypothetical protein [Candidatus Binatota bacterium]
MSEEPSTWKRCSSCKREIGFERVYWVCSVSTCNRKGTDFAFCSVECWDAHLPVMRHREAWAEEVRAPSRTAFLREQASAAAAAATPPLPAKTGPGAKEGDAVREMLVIASRLKQYVRARSGMNTSDGVLDVLSDRLRELCDRAIVNAERAGRRTVLERDLE